MCSSGSEDMVFRTWKSIPSDLSSLHTGKGLWLIWDLYAFFLLTGVELSPAALSSPYTQGMSHLCSSSGLPLVYALLRRPTLFPTMPMSFIKKTTNSLIRFMFVLPFPGTPGTSRCRRPWGSGNNLKNMAALWKSCCLQMALGSLCHCFSQVAFSVVHTTVYLISSLSQCSKLLGICVYIPLPWSHLASRSCAFWLLLSLLLISCQNYLWCNPGCRIRSVNKCWLQ